MFVDNETDLTVHVARGSFDDLAGEQLLPLGPRLELERAFATVTVHETFDLTTGAPVLAEVPAGLERGLRTHLTNGTSVTFTAHVEGTRRGETLTHVGLSVEAESLQLVARSERRWMRAGQRWTPTVARGFEPFPLAWSEAFGGTPTIPPGRNAAGLPCPPMPLPHMYNPVGKGYAPREDLAEGVELPRIELLGEELTDPLAQPMPGGFAPCPDAAGLRWVNPYDRRTHLGRPCHESPFLAYHVAPLRTVFEDLKPGARIAWTGLVGAARQLDIPAPRSSARWDTAALHHVGRRLRTVHVDLDRGRVHLLVQHAALMSDRKLPRNVAVTEVER